MTKKKQGTRSRFPRSKNNAATHPPAISLGDRGGVESGIEVAANHMEVVVSYEIQDTDLLSDRELVSYVRRVLRSVSPAAEDNSNHYNQLVEAVKNTHNDKELLVTTLKALTGAVSCIDVERHQTLLSHIFGMSMWRCREDVMNALADLIISMAASNGTLVDLCLNMLVRDFIPPENFLLYKEKQVLNCVHSVLKNITDLVPLALMMLLEILPQKMPNIFGKAPVTTAMKMYVENMLRRENSPTGEPLRETILMALVDRLMDLDVVIDADDILLDDSSKGMFDMELEDVEEPAHYAVKAEDKAFAEKLDSLMVITCEHLKLCFDSGRLIEIFEILLKSFKITVLEAKSKFTQFVIFYACSLDPEYCGKRFAYALVDIFEHDKNSSLRRASAVAYLASYLSRARLLESSFVIDIFNRLVVWCYEYCQNHDGHRRTVSLEAHQVFYSACQAIMYVLCFRMRAMMPRLKPQLLERIFQDPLDPLKVCLPSIVQEFLCQTKAVGLFGDSDDFLFNNLPESDLSKAYCGMERLDMLFPFDPCLLKNCARFIRPSFIRWSDVIPPYIVDEEDEDMTSDEDNNNHVVDGIDGKFSDDDVMGRSHDQDSDDGFENSLNKMSISPRSTLEYNMAAYGGFQKPMRMPARIRPSTSPECL